MPRGRLRGLGANTAYETRMLIVLSLGWASLQAGRFVLPPLLPRITETLGFSPAGIGTALTVFGLVYAVTQYPAGTYSDVLSRATLLVPGFLILLVGFLVLTVSITTTLFFASMVILGIGKGLVASPSRALLGDLFSSTQGRALGIYSAGTDLGGILASGLAVLVLATTVWRVAFLPVIVLLALVTVLFVVWNREAYHLDWVSLAPGETAGRIVATSAQRELVLAFAIFYFFVGGLVNFFPTLLVDGGVSEAFAGGTFALLFAVGLVTKPTAGDISDRYPRLLVALAGILVAVLGLSIVLLAPSFRVVLAGTVLVALGYKTQFPIADAVIMDAAPAENVGGDLGAARAIFLTANALGPGFVGLVAEFADFATAFWLLAASLLASAALLARRYLASR